MLVLLQVSSKPVSKKLSLFSCKREKDKCWKQNGSRNASPKYLLKRFIWITLGDNIPGIKWNYRLRTNAFQTQDESMQTIGVKSVKLTKPNTGIHLCFLSISSIRFYQKILYIYLIEIIMQRWFFANEEFHYKEKRERMEKRSMQESIEIILPDVEFHFYVTYNGKLCSNEIMAITGNLPLFGEWEVDRCLLMKRAEGNNWFISLELPRKQLIYYRYLIVAIYGKNRKFVRFWETHDDKRSIELSPNMPIEDDKRNDLFGKVNGKYQVDRGWLRHDATVIQFKVFNAPIALAKPSKATDYYVKISPIKIKMKTDCKTKAKDIFGVRPKLPDSQNMEETFAFCEVTSLKEHEDEFGYQSKYGKVCSRDDLLLFNITLNDFENTAYEIDIYYYPLKVARDHPPYHLGYILVMPQQLKGSEGSLAETITCASTHRAIGVITIDYLIVRPLPDSNFKMEATYCRYWNPKRKIMNIGRRGCGVSHWHGNNILRENTIESIKWAIESGADMVEFDVAWTKDKAAVLYHDIMLDISPNDDIDIHEHDIFRFTMDENEKKELLTYAKKLKSDLLTVPINQFTLEQLQRVKVYEPPIRSFFGRPKSPVKHVENRPFVTLPEVFEKIPTDVYLVIDLKWPMQLKDRNWEGGVTTDEDLNEFVDTILEITFRLAGSRRIAFSSLKSDICTMLRLKQNKYPAIFFAKGYDSDYLDPLTQKLFNMCAFAHAMQLLGIGTNNIELLNNIGNLLYIKKTDLRIISWGAENRALAVREKMEFIEVNGIIWDRINKDIAPPDLQQNIGYIEGVEDTQEDSDTKPN
uniref:GP-PDE domain-containing protein n=1 Tax=Glossina austeni TaxID=7395 RepID=A0A1A9VUR8_GLOAU